MAFRRKWKPSKTAAREFGQKMDEIAEFCIENGISQSRSGDSYYFTINGKKYRVSNHTIAASNRGAFDELTGEKKRELYHNDATDEIQIFAGKTRIVQIYQDLVAGYELDRRGNRGN